MTDERALSNLLHETLDREDPIGPFQRLQLELEKSSGAAYRRRGRRNLMTRNRLMLLAAALVALLLASVLVARASTATSLRLCRPAVPASTRRR